MAGGLLLLLDDIATVLDDIAVMSKVAAKKTAGVLGDDLALNAQQVSGVRADRELPVVWKVTKGSLINKLILVPLALLISFIAPWLIHVLLMIGGLFLCYEGVEKVLHSLQHRTKKMSEHRNEILDESNIDLAKFEQEKVKGAIRTDFILSAEIVVISLGTVATAPFLDKLMVLSIIAVVMTLGVYGLVGVIVKIDDFGLYLTKKSAAWQHKIGDALLAFAPILMKLLTIVGTIAMFLVGGGIIMHTIPLLHHITEASIDQAQHIPAVGAIIGTLAPTLLNFGVGFIAGAIVLGCIHLMQKLRSTAH